MQQLLSVVQKIEDIASKGRVANAFKGLTQMLLTLKCNPYTVQLVLPFWFVSVQRPHDLPSS